MKLIKAILLIILLFITIGCNDNKISGPYDFIIYDEEYFKDKTLSISIYDGNVIPWKILDYNYYLLVDSYYGFVFIFNNKSSQNKELNSQNDDKDIFEVKVIDIDLKNPSNELFITKLEEYLNTKNYYCKDKLNIIKLNSIKNTIKEYLYVVEQNIYDENFEKLTLKTFHKGILIKNELIKDNYVIWNFENSFNSKTYKVELSIFDNMYKIKIL